MFALELRQPLGHGSGQLPHRAGHFPGVLGEVASLQVHGIASEQLVCTLAGEHHLHILPGVLGQEVQGDLRGVGQGLVQHVLDFRYRVEKFVGADLVGDVFHPNGLGEFLGIGQFAVLFLCVAHRESFHLFRALADLPHHIAGIHPGGEETAHLHVGNLVHGHRFLKFLLDLLFPVLQGLVLLNLVLDAVVPLHRQVAVLVGKAVSSRQLVHVFEDGVLIGDIFIGQVLGDLLLVQLLFKTRMGEKTFDLRPEQELVSLLVIVEGLDAENVPGAEELLLFLVPDDKGKHAPQLLQNLLPVLLVPVENGLRIRAGFKHMALFQQVVPQGLKVVNLPVEHQHLGAVLVEKGLPAALQVDDGKPPEAQGNACIHIIVRVVRSPVDNPVRHGLYHVFRACHLRRISKSHKTTHGQKSSLFYEIS